MTHSIKRTQLFFIIALILNLSACSVFSPIKVETPTKYVLQKTPSLQKHKKHRGSILIAQPSTDTMFDTTSMAYSSAPYTINYFVKNEWAELPTNMIQGLLVKTLIKTNYFKGVLSQPTYAQYDYILNTRLIELKQVFYGNKSAYQIKMRAELINAKSSRLIASKEFHVNQTSLQYNPEGGVVAANVAVKKILRDIALFSIARAR